jgi:signal peptide peptidase SppA
MSKRSYEHVVSFALSHPWALMPEMLSVIASILAHRVAGEPVSRDDIEAALVNRKNLPQPRAGSVARIPIYGVISPRMNLMAETSGGTSYDKIAAQLHEAMADKAVRTILLDIDSPGGNVAGSAELASVIMRARTRKPILAQIQFTGGSAAYHLASASTEIIAAPSARVGAIGTYGIHNDLSEALKQLGINRTYIYAGEGKVDGNETAPPSEAFLARAQKSIDEAYSQFVGNVVKGRGKDGKDGKVVTTEMVRNEWKAHVYGSDEAKSLGMIDTVGTLEDTVVRLLSASPDAEDRRVALDLSSIYDTSQELAARATDQDRQSEIRWQNTVERDRDLLEL